MTRPEPLILMALLALANAAAPAGADPSQPLPAWVHDVHDRGIGPLRIGMSTAEAARAVAGEGGALASELAAPDPTCRVRTVRGIGPRLRLLLVEDQLARIDVEAPEIRTPRGAGLGSTLAQLKRAYPNAGIRQRGGGAGRTATVPHESGYYLVFQTDPDAEGRQRVTRYWVGRMPEARREALCP